MVPSVIGLLEDLKDLKMGTVVVSLGVLCYRVHHGPVDATTVVGRAGGAVQ